MQQSLSQAAQIIGYIFVVIVAIGVASLVLWSVIRGRYRKEVHETETERLRPYKEAADGYKLQVEQLERDKRWLEEENERREKEIKQLRARQKELEKLLLELTETNSRQQGEIDKLKRQVEDIGNLKREFLDVLAEVKLSRS